jgi:phosphate-selective porin OprO and OprP
MRSTAVLTAALVLGAGTAAAQAPSLEAQLQTLDQQVRILERKLEIDRENAAVVAATAPVIRADGRGLSIVGRDFSFLFRGTFQADGRWFTGDAVPTAGNDTFILRRLRPVFEGTVGSLAAYRLMPEFAGNNATVVDAWIDLKLHPQALLRVGKQKGPIGLERLQSASALHFIERGLPTELAPNRETGLTLQGAFANQTLQYAVGVYNGTRDGEDGGATDNDGLKDVALRVFYEPTPGVGIGIAGSTGSREGGAPRNYATVDRRGGTTFVNGVLYDGTATRISPQAYFYRGSLGLIAEYIQSTQELTNGTTQDELSHDAWQLLVSYVLSGEDNSFRGLRPAQPYQAGGPGWGAFELVARVGELSLDGDAATLGYVAATGVESVSNIGVGVNWHLTGNVKASLNYNQTDFSNFSGADREKEKSIFTRLQLAF